MTMAGWWLILVTAGCTASANLLFRMGIKRVGGLGGTLSGMSKGLLRLATQPLVALGTIFYGLSALFWFRVVSTESLSTAYPLLVSLVFVIITLGASTMFRESITRRKLAGLVAMRCGRSSSRMTRLKSTRKRSRSNQATQRRITIWRPFFATSENSKTRKNNTAQL